MFNAVHTAEFCLTMKPWGLAWPEELNSRHLE